MILLVFYPDQSEESFKEYVSSLKGELQILSYKTLSWIDSTLFSPGELPKPDDCLIVISKYLSLNKDIDLSKEITIIDWETGVSLSEEPNTKKTNFGFKILEGQVPIQDFRLPPFMENLLKICNSLNLSGTKRLFESNPNILIPSLIKGSKKDLLNCIDHFIKIRSSIPSKNFTGVLPIFNSEFYICK